jgi:hypothetical protein
MSTATSGDPQPATVGPTNPPGSPSPPPKLPSTFPEQTAQLVDVLRTSNSELNQKFEEERSKLEKCNESSSESLRESAALRESNARLTGENARLLEHVAEIRDLRKADRARHAIVAIIASAACGVAGGMIDTTSGDTQKNWLCVLLSGISLLVVYSLLVYSDDVRLGLIRYGMLGSIIKLLFGRMFGLEERQLSNQGNNSFPAVVFVLIVLVVTALILRLVGVWVL